MPTPQEFRTPQSDHRQWNEKTQPDECFAYLFIGLEGDNHHREHACDQRDHDDRRDQRQRDETPCEQSGSHGL